jgi:CheY-like chemotaxis protein
MNSQKILIVDDEQLMHVLYRRPLQQAGYELLTASSGQEALEVVSREAPQLIIMDIMMPGMDGLSTIRALRASEAGQKIPVIVATANLERYTTAIRESQNSGAVSFLSKPLSPARLVEEVKRFALANSTSEQQIAKPTA